MSPATTSERAKTRRRGGKRGKAQRTHLRAWKEEHASSSGGANGTSPASVREGGAQGPRLVIRQYHVLQKKLAQAVKRGATQEVQSLKRQIKDAGGAASYQSASARSQAAGVRKGGHGGAGEGLGAGRRFNSTEWILQELHYHKLLAGGGDEGGGAEEGKEGKEGQRGLGGGMQRRRMGRAGAGGRGPGAGLGGGLRAGCWMSGL